MANKTIYGCYNSSTGAVTFHKGNYCNDICTYSGCFVSSGEHAGQIAVVIEEASCEDTYYACFDSETGNFVLEVPEECCPYNYMTTVNAADIACCETSCGYSYGYGCKMTCWPTWPTVPTRIIVKFTGIRCCNTGELAEINGCYCLSGPFWRWGDPDGLSWGKPIELDFCGAGGFWPIILGANNESADYPSLAIGNDHDTSYDLFYAKLPGWSEQGAELPCPPFSVENLITEGCIGGHYSSRNRAYGGVATVFDASETFLVDAWDSGGYSYVIGSVVCYQGTNYTCILAHTSSGDKVPTNTTYWTETDCG